MVQKDWTVVWQGCWFQIDRAHEGLNLAGRALTVRQLRDGRVQLLWRGQKLRYRPLAQRPPRASKVRKARQVIPPASDHPWRRFGDAVGQEFWRGVKARGRAARQASRALRSASATLRPPSGPGRLEPVSNT